MQNAQPQNVELKNKTLFKKARNSGERAECMRRRREAIPLFFSVPSVFPAVITAFVFAFPLRPLR